MKTLVIYYSLGGTTREKAKALAQEREADLVEVLDEKRPGMVGAFLRCPAAISQKPGKVKPITANFDAYDRIVIMGPVWARMPAPPVNNIIAMLPAGKEVELFLVSGGSGSNQEKVKALLQRQGAKLVEYTDITTGVNP